MDATPDKTYDAARYRRSGRGKIFDSVLDLIGDTPVVRLPRLTQALKPKGEVIAKLEFFNPLASVKDRIGVAMIEYLEAKGLLKEGGTIVEPTSGNTGIALAFVAAAKGYKCVLVMPESMSVERRKMLAILGAKLELTPREKGMVGAVARAREIVDATPGAVNTTDSDLDEVSDTHFSVDRGFFTNAFSLSITSGTPDALIYVSFNSDEPGPGKGFLYTNAFPITNTTVVRVAAHSDSSSSCRRSRVSASRAPKGSSMSSIEGSVARARASAARCRMPPDN